MKKINNIQAIHQIQQRIPNLDLTNFPNFQEFLTKKPRKLFVLFCYFNRNNRFDCNLSKHRKKEFRTSHWIHWTAYYLFQKKVWEKSNHDLKKEWQIKFQSKLTLCTVVCCKSYLVSGYVYMRLVTWPTQTILPHHSKIHIWTLQWGENISENATKSLCKITWYFDFV